MIDFGLVNKSPGVPDGNVLLRLSFSLI